MNPISGTVPLKRLATCYFQKQTWQAVGPRCAQTAEAHSPSEKTENVLPHPEGWEEKRSAAFLFSPSKPAIGLALNWTSHWRGCEHQQHSQALREKVLPLTVPQ